MKSKQSPVEELLRQADELMESQKPRAEVYAAMAHSLGLAWSDLNALLLLRKQILELNVAFHWYANVALHKRESVCTYTGMPSRLALTRAEQFNDLLEKAERDFVSAPLPSDVEMARIMTSQHQELKKRMLEGLMYSLQDGQMLLENLRNLESQGTVDSRPDHIRLNVRFACNQVQRWLEELHDRRRRLDELWLRRKFRLEQSLSLLLFYEELKALESWIRSEGAKLLEEQDLGNSVSASEILLHKHGLLEKDLKNHQDKCVRLVRSAERLLQNNTAGAEEASHRAYSTLDWIASLGNAMDKRRDLLDKALEFFSKTDSVLTRLTQLEAQVEGGDPIHLEELNQRISETTEGLVSQVVSQGRELITEAQHTGTEGISQRIREIEEMRDRIQNRFKTRQEKSKALVLSKTLTTFTETFSKLEIWLTENGENFFRGHRDMGSVLAMARDFLNTHHRHQTLLSTKLSEIEAAMQHFEKLKAESQESPNFPDVQRRVKAFKDSLASTRDTFDRRCSLATTYVKFHTLAVQLANEMDSVEKLLREECWDEKHMASIEESRLSLRQNSLQLANTGRNFLLDAQEPPDQYLDLERGRLCVETLLEHFSQRNESLQDAIQAHQDAYLKNQRARFGFQQIRQESQMVNRGIRVMERAEKVMADAYPLFREDILDIDRVIISLTEKTRRVTTEIGLINADIDRILQTSKSSDMKGFYFSDFLPGSPLWVPALTWVFVWIGSSQEELENLRSRLGDAKQNLQSLASRHETLVTITTSLLKNVSELDKIREKLKALREKPLPSSADDTEYMIREHEVLSQTSREIYHFTKSEADNVSSRLKHQEPTPNGDEDSHRIQDVMAKRKQDLDSLCLEQSEILRRHLDRCRFQADFKHISSQLVELSNQLQNLRGQYGDSSSTAKSTSSSFRIFESTIDRLEERVSHFVSTAQKLISDQPETSKYVEVQLSDLQTKWSTLHMHVGETRHLIDLSIEYFTLIDEAEDWFKEGSKVLISIAKKSATITTPEEATRLLNEMESFLKPGEAKQEERIRKISTLAIQLYGASEPSQVKSVSKQNVDMMDSFGVINKNLSQLKLNMLTAKEEREKMKQDQAKVEASLEAAKAEAAAATAALAAAEEARKAAEAAAKALNQPPPLFPPLQRDIVEMSESIEILKTKTEVEEVEEELRPAKMAKLYDPPLFTLPLHDAEVDEGSTFSFECRVVGDPTPEVTWYKDGMMIQNNPDYQMSFKAGICTLTIEETFTEDSARFSCKAVNVAGESETSGRLHVRETRSMETLVPPMFTQVLQPAIVKEGESFQFECRVAGNPLPVVQWFKNDQCIDASPNYVITYNNGICVLRFEEVLLEDQAEYVCRATNSSGSEECRAALSVQALEPVETPSFPTPLSNVMARAGQKLRLECCVKGIPTPEISWLHNNRPIKENRETKMEYDGRRATLTIVEAFPKDAGSYVIFAKNKAGEATSSCNVSVKVSTDP
ncbi:unnamed protein product [Darwinula stevensoni]|uniref:Ig-like domain-containing protein n=1 Tax=Darwinula stevensoni TaxID=69355 RepID=A0A7R9A218_9CRUS|nr:unnamed protein product [Darwinula stevensoni]CAG0878666.1 unnamed protein product [Darwinula stevensoni]